MSSQLKPESKATAKTCKSEALQFEERLRANYAGNTDAERQHAGSARDDHDFRMLSAPNLDDDYYLNLVDWSSQDIVAAGWLVHYPPIAADAIRRTPAHVQNVEESVKSIASAQCGPRIGGSGDFAVFLAGRRPVVRGHTERS